MENPSDTKTAEFDADFSAPANPENPAPEKVVAPKVAAKPAQPAVQKPAPAQAAKPVEPAADAQAPEGQNADEELSEEEVYMILEGRVSDAEEAVKAARAKQAEGAKEEVEGLKVLNAARAEFKAAFPPMTQAENIKEYLASEQAKREARVAHTGQPVRVDQAFGRGNSRGWKRPTRGVMGRDGNLVKNPDGSVAVPRPMQVRPQGVVPSMGTRAAGTVQRA